jgi:hypothetical protein
MCCSCGLVAIVLGIAIWATIAGGLPRKPHLFVPLLVAFLGWLLAGIFELWDDLTYVEGDMRLERGLGLLGAIVVSAGCSIYFIVALLIGWYRSRK